MAAHDLETMADRLPALEAIATGERRKEIVVFFVFFVFSCP